MSDTEVKRIKADELTPDIRNANRGTERGRYALETSLREYGAGRSIVIDKAGRIIAGNKTLETAAEMGLDDVLVVQTDGRQIVAVQRMDLDLAQDDKARMLAYADNRVGQLDLDFDPAMIAEDIAAGLNLDLFWQNFELDEILEALQPEPTPGEDTEPEIDKAEELRQKWGVETGQLWQLGEHRLICGDCTDAEVVERVMAGEKADLCFTSPPYNGNTHLDYGKGKNKKLYETFQDNYSTLDYLKLCHNCIFQIEKHVNGFLFWNISYNANSRWQFIDTIYPFREFLWEVIVWKKKGMPISSGLTRDFEFIFCLKFGDEKAHLSEKFKTASNLWEISNSGANDIDTHRAAFPVELPERAIELSAAGCVYEPFSGSGTTIIACENLKRRCRAVEISPGYVAVALERWHQHTGKMPELITQD